MLIKKGKIIVPNNIEEAIHLIKFLDKANPKWRELKLYFWEYNRSKEGESGPEYFDAYSYELRGEKSVIFVDDTVDNHIFGSKIGNWMNGRKDFIAVNYLNEHYHRVLSNIMPKTTLVKIETRQEFSLDDFLKPFE